MSATKICPLLLVVGRGLPVGPEVGDDEADEMTASCVREACAWWHQQRCECSMLVLATATDTIERQGMG